MILIGYCFRSFSAAALLSCTMILICRCLSTVYGQCSGMAKMLNSQTGNVESPNFPNPYPSNVVCTWFITISGVDYISLKFDSFATQFGGNCQYDYLQITSQHVGDKLCGVNPPDKTYVGYSLILRFISDQSTSEAGFNITYSSGVYSTISSLTTTGTPSSKTRTSSTSKVTPPSTAKTTLYNFNSPTYTANDVNITITTDFISKMPIVNTSKEISLTPTKTKTFLTSIKVPSSITLLVSTTTSNVIQTSEPNSNTSDKSENINDEDKGALEDWVIVLIVMLSTCSVLVAAIILTVLYNKGILMKHQQLKIEPEKYVDETSPNDMALPLTSKATSAAPPISTEYNEH